MWFHPLAAMSVFISVKHELFLYILIYFKYSNDCYSSTEVLQNVFAKDVKNYDFTNSVRRYIIYFVLIYFTSIELLFEIEF